jgi:hypothetical protein
LHDSHLLHRLRFFFDLRFRFGLDVDFGLRLDLGFHLGFDSRFRLFFNQGNVNRLCSFDCGSRRLLNDLYSGCGQFGCQRAKLLAKLVRQTVFDGVGVRRNRHTHVLQFTNDFGIVEIQFPG